MLQIDFSGLYTLVDEVVVHFDVFSPRVEDGVPSEVDVAHVVTKEANWIHNGNAQILQYALDPYDFTCGDCRAPVFGFCAQQCDC